MSSRTQGQRPGAFAIKQNKWETSPFGLLYWYQITNILQFLIFLPYILLFILNDTQVKIQSNLRSHNWNDGSAGPTGA